MRGRGLAVVAASACLGLGLAGCGGSAKPSTLPKPSASSSPSPSATPPVLPAAAKEKTKAGAIAFVRHYVDVLNYATFSGETDTARKLDGEHCESCERMLAAIDAIYENGGQVEGGAWKPSPVSQAPQPGGNGWAVDTKISYGPQDVVPSKGAEAKHYTGGGRLVTFLVEYRSGTWAVSEWTRAS